MWILGLILLVVAVGLAFGYRSRRRRQGRILSTRVVTAEHLRQLAASMAEGLGAGSLTFPAALEGTVRCAEPLEAELSQTPAVYYSAQVRRELETPAGTGEPGHDKGPQRSSEQVAQRKQSIPFELEDASGSIAVDPEGARFLAEKSLSRFEPEQSAGAALQVGRFRLTLSGTPQGTSRTLGYRFEEEAIPVGRRVYVLGEATDRGGTLRVASPAESKDFLVSVKSRDQLLRELGSGSRALLIAAIVCAVIGVLLVL